MLFPFRGGKRMWTLKSLLDSNILQRVKNETMIHINYVMLNLNMMDCSL